jgi:hypothetical protein
LKKYLDFLSGLIRGGSMTYEMKEFIKALGGNGAVATALKETPQTISNWIHRGPSYRGRFKLMALAQQRGVHLPDFFRYVP